MIGKIKRLIFHIGKQSRLAELEKLLNSNRNIWTTLLLFSQANIRNIQDSFCFQVKKAKDYVYEGEVFQVVYRERSFFEVHGDLYLYEI